jgi:hypothetical protein
MSLEETNRWIVEEGLINIRKRIAANKDGHEEKGAY